MNSEEVFEIIKSILIDIFDVSPQLIQSELAFTDLEFWDSLNRVRFLVALENELDLDFETEDLGNTNTVGELVDLLKNKVS